MEREKLPTTSPKPTPIHHGGGKNRQPTYSKPPANHIKQEYKNIISKEIEGRKALKKGEKNKVFGSSLGPQTGERLLPPPEVGGGVIRRLHAREKIPYGGKSRRYTREDQYRDIERGAIRIFERKAQERAIQEGRNPTQLVRHRGIHEIQKIEKKTIQPPVSHKNLLTLSKQKQRSIQAQKQIESMKEKGLYVEKTRQPQKIFEIKPEKQKPEKKLVTMGFNPPDILTERYDLAREELGIKQEDWKKLGSLKRTVLAFTRRDTPFLGQLRGYDYSRLQKEEEFTNKLIKGYSKEIQNTEKKKAEAAFMPTGLEETKKYKKSLEEYGKQLRADKEKLMEYSRSLKEEERFEKKSRVGRSFISILNPLRGVRKKEAKIFGKSIPYPHLSSSAGVAASGFTTGILAEGFPLLSGITPSTPGVAAEATKLVGAGITSELAGRGGAEIVTHTTGSRRLGTVAGIGFGLLGGLVGYSGLSSIQKSLTTTLTTPTITGDIKTNIQYKATPAGEVIEGRLEGGPYKLKYKDIWGTKPYNLEKLGWKSMQEGGKPRIVEYSQIQTKILPKTTATIKQLRATKNIYHKFETRSGISIKPTKKFSLAFKKLPPTGLKPQASKPAGRPFGFMFKKEVNMNIVSGEQTGYSLFGRKFTRGVKTTRTPELYGSRYATIGKETGKGEYVGIQTTVGRKIKYGVRKIKPLGKKIGIKNKFVGRGVRVRNLYATTGTKSVYKRKVSGIKTRITNTFKLTASEDAGIKIIGKKGVRKPFKTNTIGGEGGGGTILKTRPVNLKTINIPSLKTLTEGVSKTTTGLKTQALAFSSILTLKKEAKNLATQKFKTPTLNYPTRKIKTIRYQKPKQEYLQTSSQILKTIPQQEKKTSTWKPPTTMRIRTPTSKIKTQTRYGMQTKTQTKTMFETPKTSTLKTPTTSKIRTPTTSQYTNIKYGMGASAWTGATTGKTTPYTTTGIYGGYNIPRTIKTLPPFLPMGLGGGGSKKNKGRLSMWKTKIRNPWGTIQFFKTKKTKTKHNKKRKRRRKK